MVGSKALLSWACPAVMWIETMNPWLSQTRWILVPKPPRERPSAWSGGSRICASLRPPNRRGRPAFFFRPGRRPAGADDGAVDAPQVVVELAGVVQFVQQRGDNADPGAVGAPAGEAIGGGLPGAVAFREVAPGSAGMQDPQDAVDDRAMVVERVSRLTVMGAVGQEGLDPSPLFVGKFVAVHGWPPWGNRPARELGLPISYACFRLSDRA